MQAEQWMASALTLLGNAEPTSLQTALGKSFCPETEPSVVIDK
jgi:hypothetical protein